jgi:hypothetical protein
MGRAFSNTKKKQAERAGGGRGCLLKLNFVWGGKTLAQTGSQALAAAAPARKGNRVGGWSGILQVSRFGQSMVRTSLQSRNPWESYTPPSREGATKTVTRWMRQPRSGYVSVLCAPNKYAFQSYNCVCFSSFCASQRPSQSVSLDSR